MKYSLETWKIVQRFVQQLKKTFEKPEHSDKVKTECPKLTFHHQSRIVVCNGIPLRLSPLLWWLLVRLSETADGHLDFVDSCVDENRSCPWRRGEETVEGSRRCAACRLSIKLWEAGIPYKVIYSQTTNCFSLILIDANEPLGTVAAITSSEFLSTGEARNVKKLVKALLFLIPVLQFYEMYDQEGTGVTILPILNVLPNPN